VAGVRCYGKKGCDSGVLDAAASPRSCCVSNPRGISYDTSGQTEICNICEVVGWRRTEVFAVEGSEVLAVFGAVKGAVGRRYVVRVEFVSNGASTSIVDSSHMESIVFGPGDTAVGIRVPRYDRDTRYMARNSTLLMVRMVPENLDRWRFFTPDQVTVVIVVPEVGFERGDYSVQYHDPTATLCLVYSNTGGGHAQFNVSVSIASQDFSGGDFSDRETFSFTQDSGRACVSVSIPPSEITDPFSDTVFTAAIHHREDFPFDLGPLNSAAVTLLALRVPWVQFDVSVATYSHPLTSVRTCLLQSPPDEIASGLSVNVSLVRQEKITYLNFVFGEDESIACQNITISSVEAQEIFLTIIEPPKPVFRMGAESSTTIVIVIEKAPTERPTYGPTVGTSPKDALNRDTTSNSGPESWVIGVAVSLPVLALTAVVTVVVLILVVYGFKRYTSYSPAEEGKCV
jgi:hypothetical protein